jgi:hypothetical protein
MFRKETYTVGGREFEIRAANFGEWIVVQAFENGKPSSLRYGVTIETADGCRVLLSGRDRRVFFLQPVHVLPRSAAVGAGIRLAAISIWEFLP